MKIGKITKEDTKDITAVFLEAVLMPNGELIRYGKSLGFIKEDLKGIFKAKED